MFVCVFFFFFQAEDGIRDADVTGVQTCALPIWAYSSLSTDERIGNFNASAQVRTSVSDSAVHEILYEMRRMQNERVSDEDLELIKNMMTGSFSRSLEDPQTVARFALNIARYNLPADYYQAYLQKLAAVTAEDVQEMAKKYLRPEQCIIVAVGEADKISETLAPFAADGKVRRYVYYGEEVKGLQAVSGVSAADVIAAYAEALGGQETLDGRSEEHTSELQSRPHLVCRLLLEKKK